jgi:hypothetical protein
MALMATALASVVGLSAVAAAAHAADWPTYGFDPQRSSYNPLEQQLSPATVGSLTLDWSFNVSAFDVTVNPQYGAAYGAVGGQSIVVANVRVAGKLKNLVLFGDNNGMVYALDANPPTVAGSVVWYQPLGNATITTATQSGQIGVRSTLLVDRTANGGLGVVYVPMLGVVHALDLTTGLELNGWPVSVLEPNAPATEGSIHDAPNLSNGQLYIGTGAYGDDSVPYNGRVAGIDTATATLSGIWYPLSGNAALPTISGGGVWGWGGVAIDDTAKAGGVYVATGNAKSGNGQVPYAENIVNLSPALTQVSAATPAFGLSPNRYDNDYGSTPVLFHPSACASKVKMLVALNKTGQLVVDAVSGEGALSVLQDLQVSSGDGGFFHGTAAWDPADQLILVSSQQAGPAPFGAGLLAFAAGSDCRQPLSLAWQTTTLANGGPLVPAGSAISSPTVANGVAYFAVGGTTSNVFAVAAASSGAVTAGQILWQSGTIAACTAGLSLTVIDASVIFGCQGIAGSVNAFRLPAN